MKRDMKQGSGGQNRYLFKIGTSVLTSMTINHDPQGIVGFHPDGAPIQTTLSLNFKEIEYLLSGDSAEETGLKQATSDYGHEQGQGP